METGRIKNTMHLNSPMWHRLSGNIDRLTHEQRFRNVFAAVLIVAIVLAFIAMAIWLSGTEQTTPEVKYYPFFP